MTSTPPPTTIREPTATPTLMTEPGPPELVHANCTVRRERHLYGDDRVTSLSTTRYNGTSRRAWSHLDSSGAQVDGVIDRVLLYEYHNEWMILRVEQHLGIDSPLDYAIDSIYDRDHRRIERHHDTDGDSVVDHIDYFTYDDAGRVIVSDTGGLRISYTYDEAGRILTKTTQVVSPGVPPIEDRYIWENDLIVAIESDVLADGIVDDTWTYEYDEQGRLIRWTDTAGEWTAEYTEEGWIAKVDNFNDSVWQGTATWSYDAAGRLTRDSFEGHAGDNEYSVYENQCPDGG